MGSASLGSLTHPHFRFNLRQTHWAMWVAVQWGTLPASSALLQDGQASIILKEMLPIVLACAVWGQQWQNTSVLVHCDNQGEHSHKGYGVIPYKSQNFKYRLEPD